MKLLTIPECRSHLMLIAGELKEAGFDKTSREIRIIVRHMKRRSPVRVTSVKSPPITPQIRSAVIQYARINLDASQHEIAKKFGINTGRVSEILAGKRR